MIANSASATTGAAATKISPLLTILARVWPPTRAKATNILVVFLAGATLIGGTIVPKKGKTHRAFIAKKKELKIEQLTKLLEEARRCRPASAEAKAAIEKIEDSLLVLSELRNNAPLGPTDGAAQVDEARDGDEQQLLLWPAERQEWLQSTLVEKDGVELAIKVCLPACHAC